MPDLEVKLGMELQVKWYLINIVAELSCAQIVHTILTVVVVVSSKIEVKIG